MTERIANGLMPVLDLPAENWPEWLTVSEALAYAGCSRATLAERAKMGRVIREGQSRASRYWRPSLEVMRRAFGGGVVTVHVHGYALSL
jgi:hypothetical protein